MRSFLPYLALIGGVGCALGGNVEVDGTMGKVAPLTGPLLQITEDFGYRPNQGPNLFHSFRYFSLSNGDVAVFSGSAGINNVLARVTGPDASTINGKIQSTIPGANFFLINPRGIIFGPGASLDIGGSFVATTANSVKLADGGHFDAVDQGKAPLTVAPPAAFGFLTSNPAAITVNSTELSVSNGHSISFIGGDVNIENASVDAHDSGAVHVIGARGTGNVNMDFRTVNPTPSIGTGLAGANVNMTAANLGAAGTTRKVVIRGGKLTTVDSYVNVVASARGDGISARMSDDISATGANFFVATVRGNLEGEPLVEMTARNALFTDGSAMLTFSENGVDKGEVHLSISGKLTFSKGASMGEGSGGGVRIEAGSMLLSEGAEIATSPADPLPAGHIYINVAGALDMVEGGRVTVNQSSAAPSDIFVTAGSIFMSGAMGQRFSGVDSTLNGGGDGRGGIVKLDVSGRLEIRDAARIQGATFDANGAQIEISAGEVLIANSNPNQDTGIFATNRNTPGTIPPGRTAGSIRIDTQGDLKVLGSASIIADTTNLGPGGTIDIAAHRIFIEGRGIEHGTLSRQGIRSLNRTQGASGDSGSIQIDFRDSLTLTNGAEILATTFGTGRGGNIRLTGGSLSMSDDSLISAETSLPVGGGPGGNVDIFLNGLLSIGGGSRVSVATLGSGPGGSANLRVRELSLSGPNSAILATTSSSGRGGGISLEADVASIFDGARISAATTGLKNAGAGGDLQLLIRDSLTVKEGGVASVESFGSGKGGSIQIQAGQFALLGSSSGVLATASGAGAGGSISIGGQEARVADGGRVAAETLGATGGGAGGNIQVRFDNKIEIKNGGQISAATFGSGMGGSIEVRADAVVITGDGSAISAQSLGAPLGGDGGNIFLKADELLLADRGAILVSSAGSGLAGNIDIDVANRVTLSGGSSITAAALQSSGGEIRIDGGAQIVLQNSRITAEAQTLGGNITLLSRDLLDVFRSRITAAATSDGGNIFIDPQFVILDGAIISANAVIGRGGNIQIFSDFFFASPDSLVTASSERGINGEVRINGINVDLTGNIVDLPASFIRAESLLRELCTVKLQDFSSLIMEGRGGMAPVPGEWLSSLEPELPQKELSTDQ